MSLANVLEGLYEGFESAVAEILIAIGQILPVVIPIVSAMTLISVGYRVFKRFAK
jgi:hypothetical protein